MKKNFPKVMLSVFAGVSSVVFLVLLTSNLLLKLVAGAFFWQIILLVVASLFAGLTISIGYSAFSPLFSDAIVVLRRLLRFESLSNPLLLRLSYEAPGTFHHVVNVSILAQKAAKSIGADTLLVRIGAYYHDIGKLYNPALFIENQSGDEIPRTEDLEKIKMTAQQIIAHVKKGLEIAEQNHLPPEITSFIAEHHGTTKMLYFYEEAKKKGLKVRKIDFKYAGPAPLSKESAIVMLADSVEAAARAVSEPTGDKFTNMVEDTIREKIGENQLRNCRLTEDDLAKIKLSLSDSLKSIYHQRMVKKDA